MSGTRTNWAGNVTFQADRVHRPETVEQLQEIVAASDRVRALGTGHSFSPVADTTGDLVSVAGLPARFEVAPDRPAVTVSAGLRYGEVATRLHGGGPRPAQPRLAAAHLGRRRRRHRHPRVGRPLGSLATAVTALELVTADGRARRLSRGGRRPVRRLPSSRSAAWASSPRSPCASGRPTTSRSGSTRTCRSTRLRTELDEVFAAGVQRQRLHDLGRRRRRPGLGQAPGRRPAACARRTWLGAEPPTDPRTRCRACAAEACTEQLGVPGPWHERLPHFRLDHTPSSGTSCRPEYLVPREHAVEALHAVAAIRERVAPVLQVCELRTVAADDLWLSPAYGTRRARPALHLGRRHRRRPAGRGRPRGPAARFTPGRTGARSSAPARTGPGLYPRLADFAACAASWTRATCSATRWSTATSGPTDASARRR